MLQELYDIVQPELQPPIQQPRLDEDQTSSQEDAEREDDLSNTFDDWFFLFFVCSIRDGDG